jgi:hypothetical protein
MKLIIIEFRGILNKAISGSKVNSFSADQVTTSPGRGGIPIAHGVSRG